MQSLALEFREFINENFLFGQMNGHLADEDSLLEKGIIDSTGVLELIGFIENTYQIKFDDSDLTPENLDSISNLVRFVERKRSLQSPNMGGSLAGSSVS
jgi:acyl carrier protein